MVDNRNHGQEGADRATRLFAEWRDLPRAALDATSSSVNGAGYVASQQGSLGWGPYVRNHGDAYFSLSRTLL